MLTGCNSGAVHCDGLLQEIRLVYSLLATFSTIVVCLYFTFLIYTNLPLLLHLMHLNEQIVENLRCIVSHPVIVFWDRMGFILIWSIGKVELDNNSLTTYNRINNVNILLMWIIVTNDNAALLFTIYYWSNSAKYLYNLSAYLINQGINQTLVAMVPWHVPPSTPRWRW